MIRNLIERYLYAVGRHLPQKIRADVLKEVDGLISEMLEERCGDTPPTEKDIKIVLLELGTPEELASNYLEDEQKVLISGVYFINYKRVLKLVIPILSSVIFLGMTIATVNELAVSPPVKPAWFVTKAFVQILGSVLEGIWQSFAIITIVFALLERFNASMNSYGDNFLDELPELPEDGQLIKLGETIISIVFSTAVVVLFLGVPQIMGVMLNGTWIPLFDVAVLRSLWLPIVAWGLSDITYNCLALMEGRYTTRLAIFNVMANLLLVGCAAIVFLWNSVFNPVFIENMGTILKHEADELIPWLSNAHLIVFASFCVIAVFESVSVSLKARKYRQPDKE